jgi:hypothetical protein
MYGDPLYVVLCQLYLAGVHANAHWNVKPVQWRHLAQNNVDPIVPMRSSGAP